MSVRAYRPWPALGQVSGYNMDNFYTLNYFNYKPCYYSILPDQAQACAGVF